MQFKTFLRTFIMNISWRTLNRILRGRFNYRLEITVRYKILEGENFGEFGELPQNRQNFLVQKFLH